MNILNKINWLLTHYWIKRVLLAFLLFALSTELAYSWNYKEHSQIGYEAYKLACEELQNDKTITGESLKFLNKFIFKDIEIWAKKYGQAVALSGDYLSSPNKFLADIDKGLREVNELYTYGLLALNNNGHFFPEVSKKWIKYRLKALKMSESIKINDSYLKNVSTFEKALYTNAYADHFLYDSFATGHMGFNRPSSRPTTSKTHHDLWNYSGRFLRDRNNQIWYGMGDYYLNIDRNKYGREKLLLVAKMSISNLLRRCIGTVNSDSEESIYLNMPVAYLDPNVCSWIIEENKKYTIYKNEYINPVRNDISNHDTSENWIPLDLFLNKVYIIGTLECYYMGYDYLDKSELEFVFPVYGITFAIPTMKTRLRLGTSHFGSTATGNDGFYDIGVVVPLFYKHPSPFSFDINGGVASRIGTHNDIYYANDSYYFGITTNLELGNFNIFLTLAPAFVSHRGLENSNGLGYHYSFGLSRVVRSKGGDLLEK